MVVIDAASELGYEQHTAGAGRVLFAALREVAYHEGHAAPWSVQSVRTWIADLVCAQRARGHEVGFHS